MPQFSLTDRFAAGAKSKQIQTDYFDDKVPGLSLRVTSSGCKTWSLIFTLPGDAKRARMTLGRYPQTSLARARTLATEARGLLDEGRDPRDVLATNASGAVTVAALIESYLEKHARPHRRTAREIERRLAKNVTPIIGTVKLAGLHRRDINRVVDPVLKRECPVEAGRVFEDVRAVLRWAVARGDLNHNPMEGMRKPNHSVPRDRVLTDDEIAKLWTNLPTVLTRSKACQSIVKLCLLTAQRVGEVAGMAANELDIKTATWTIPGTRTNNGHKHVVPLSAAAIEIIKEAISEAEGEFAFPSRNRVESLPAMAVATTILRAQQRFGLAHWTAHDLRRTAVSGMAKLGIPPIVLGHIINHRSVTKAGITLSVYAQYDYDREKRDALNRWAERVAAIVTPSGAAMA
jgi:integrase